MPPLNLVPTIKKLKNIRRKIANTNQFQDIQVRVYKYKNANIKIKDMKKAVNKITKRLREKGLTFNVNTSFMTPFGWRSGKQTQNDANVETWTAEWGTNDERVEGGNNAVEEWYDDGNAKIKTFEIVLQVIEEEGGSDDDFNDCLYDTLYFLLREKLKALWPTAWKLKKSLNIKRQDKINTKNHMDKIEKWLNVGIFIEGDVTRTPKESFKNNVTILLKNGHYSKKTTAKKNAQPLISFKEKIPVFYSYDFDEEMYYFVQGDNPEKIRKATKDSFQTRLEEQQATHFFNQSPKDDLERNVSDFIYNANKLKTISSGRINMFKTNTIKNTALDLFFSLTQHIQDADDICANEAKFLTSCYRGGILYAEKYEGPAYKGDVCSMYPSFMQSNYFVPYKKGEFCKVTQKEVDQWKREDGKQYYHCGIYKAEVEKNGSSKERLFHFNEKNYYTHTDLEIAHKLGFQVKIIENGEMNCIKYPSHTTQQFSGIFGQFVQLLFNLKKEYPNVTYIKRILNILWGALSEFNISRTYTLTEDNEVTLKEHEQISRIRRFNDGYKIECRDDNKLYKSGFARIAPFLTSLGRKKIAELALQHVKHIKNIYRIHTDSIVTSEELNLTPKEHCELGEFGFEGFAEFCKVVHVNKVEFSLSP